MPDESADAAQINPQTSVPLDYNFPDDLPTYFIETAVAQFVPDHFILSFFEVWPPLLAGDTVEAQVAALSTLKSVRAKCVSRLVVTPTKMKELVVILSRSLEGFEQAEKSHQGK